VSLAETAVAWATVAFSLGGWLLYFRERERSRDYVTDLLQVVYDHDLGRDDLRRSTNWSEVETSQSSLTRPDSISFDTLAFVSRRSSVARVCSTAPGSWS